MKNKIRYGKSVIQYKVVKSKRRKTSEIIVDEKGVEVRTPITKKDSQIKQLVDDKKQWIFKKKLEFSDRTRKKIKKTKPLTEKYLENRTKKLASQIAVKPTKIVIKKLKGRWGSSTKNGVINLNIALTKAPPRVADYIVIHELCHLKVREHSRRYWSLVRKHMKNYEERVRWLEAHRGEIL